MKGELLRHSTVLPWRIDESNVEGIRKFGPWAKAKRQITIGEQERGSDRSLSCTLSSARINQYGKAGDAVSEFT